MFVLFFPLPSLHHFRLNTHTHTHTVPHFSRRSQSWDSAERIRFVCVTLFIRLFVLPFTVFFFFSFRVLVASARDTFLFFYFFCLSSVHSFRKSILATLPIFCLAAPNTALCLSAATTSLIYRNVAAVTTDNCVAFFLRGGPWTLAAVCLAARPAETLRSDTSHPPAVSGETGGGVGPKYCLMLVPLDTKSCSGWTSREGCMQSC